MTYITRIYCDKPDCNVRTCDIITKDGFRLPDPKTWFCPGCGGEAQLRWRREGPEYQREIERKKLRVAIGEVNAALYVREHATPRGYVSVPADIYRLDRLPDSWKAQDVKSLRGTINRGGKP